MSASSQFLPASEEDVVARLLERGVVECYADSPRQQILMAEELAMRTGQTIYGTPWDEHIVVLTVTDFTFRAWMGVLTNLTTAADGSINLNVRFARWRSILATDGTFLAIPIPSDGFQAVATLIFGERPQVC